MLILEGHTSTVLNLAFNEDGTCLVTLGHDQKVIVWNLEFGEGLFAPGDVVATLSGQSALLFMT